MSAKFVQRMSTSKIQKPLSFAHAFLFFLSTMWIIGGCDIPRSKNENKLVFTMNIFSGISTLDPAFAKDQSAIWTTHQIFNGLVKLDQHLQPLPDLAKSWEISADLKTYTFHLKRDVFFHESLKLKFKSRAFNAHDFLFSFQRVMDPEVASSGAWIFNEKVDSLHPFEAPNDSTFIIRLRRPFAPFLGLLSMPYASVVAKETVNNKDFATHPVGTGPFQVFEHGPGEALILHKNPRYHESDSEGV
jgi:peptide/nickel transport system substrate-binding protein